MGVTLTDAEALLKILGLLGSGGFGLLKLIKWLKGKKPRSVTQLQNGNVRIEVHGDVQGDVSIVTKPQAAALYSDPQIREALRGLVAPLRDPGITSFSVIERDKVVETIEKKEVEAFSAPPELPPQEEVLVDSEQIIALEITKIAFERGKWELSDGTAYYPVTLEDSVFLSRVDDRQLRFGKGDILRVRMETRTVRSDGKLRSSYRVLEVLEVIEPTTPRARLSRRERAPLRTSRPKYPRVS